MGRAKRVIPEKMPEKLKVIRENLGLSLEAMAVELEAMLKKLNYPEIRLYSGNIHEFEKGTREPMLPVLLSYSRIAKTTVDILIDNQKKSLKPTKKLK